MQEIQLCAVHAWIYKGRIIKRPIIRARSGREHIASALLFLP